MRKIIYIFYKIQNIQPKSTGLIIWFYYIHKTKHQPAIPGRADSRRLQEG